MIFELLFKIIFTSLIELDPQWPESEVDFNLRHGLWSSDWCGNLGLDSNDGCFFIRFVNHLSLVIGSSSVIISGFLRVFISSLNFFFGVVIVITILRRGLFDVAVVAFTIFGASVWRAGH